MKKICLYARAERMEAFAKMYEIAKEVDCVYIVQNSKEEKFVSNYVPKNKIYNVTKFFQENWNNHTLLDSINFKIIEEKYNIESIWSLLYTDRYLIKYDYNICVKYIKLHIAFAEFFFNKEKPDVFADEDISVFSSYIFYKIYTTLGCKLVGFSAPRNMATSKVLYTNNELCYYEEIDKYYQNQDINSKEIKEAKAIIDDIIKNNTKPEYMLVEGKKPVLKDFFKGIGKFIIHKYIKNKEKYDYMREMRHKVILSNALNIVRYNRQKRYYSKPKEGEKFILFPLHFEPESATLVKAFNYENQLYTASLIAKNLPGDCILYVKEHFARVGHRKMLFYKELSKMQNVKIIDPWIDSHTLIQKAEAIIALTSTVGWEGLIFRKPVFVLGDVFYDKFKYCYKIDGFNALANKIKTGIKHFNEIPEDDYQNEFSKYFASYLKAMYDGNFVINKNVNNENVELLYKVILKNINN